MDKKRIKVEATRTDTHGNGYYRGEDGHYYYGNKKNGYVTETLEEQKKRRWKLDAKKQSSSAGSTNGASASYTSHSPAKPNNLGAVLALVFILTFIIDILYIFAVAPLFIAWPQHLKTLFSNYAEGRIDWGLLLATVVTVCVVGLFVYGLYAILMKERKCAKYFALVTTAVITVMYLILPITHPLSLYNVVRSLLKGICLAFVPTVLLYAAEYRASGVAHPFRRLAKFLCQRIPGHNWFFNYMGVANFVFFVIALIVYVGTGEYDLPGALLEGRYFAELGALSLYIGIASQHET